MYKPDYISIPSNQKSTDFSTQSNISKFPSVLNRRGRQTTPKKYSTDFGDTDDDEEEEKGWFAPIKIEHTFEDSMSSYGSLQTVTPSVHSDDDDDKRDDDDDDRPNDDEERTNYDRYDDPESRHDDSSRKTTPDYTDDDEGDNTDDDTNDDIKDDDVNLTHLNITSA